MKLVSMVEFALNVPTQGMEVQSIGIQGNNRYQKCIRYASFLSQKLEIWKFIPCKLVDGIWVVLDFPILKGIPRNASFNAKYQNDRQEYQQAKEACLFEGFEIKFKDCKEFKYQSEKIILVINESTYIEYNCYHKNFTLYIDDIIRKYNIETIEDLVKYNLKLTATAQKQL